MSDYHDKRDSLVIACENLSLEDRGSYLNLHCDNAELRSDVEDLLSRIKEEDANEERLLQNEMIGKTIDDRYEIKKELGSGGMGSVYEAIDTKTGDGKRVAIKIIKPGMDSQAVLNRFKREELTLSMMNHSGICRISETGFYNKQFPYFAMELIHGEPLTDFCNRERLSIKDRVKLYCEICSAVQHAHSRGVLHRDIKPTNILAYYEDSVAHAKIIDFGIAKALSSHQIGDTELTLSGQPIGSLPYLSPEQAEMSPVPLGTESDVYSLGILLFELLAGRLPAYTNELNQVPRTDAARVIRDSTSKPSTEWKAIVVKTPKEADQIAKFRKVSTNELSKKLHGDLDRIIMKCIEKDRSRRYNTVDALNEDLNRYLSNIPILAEPPSVIYSFKKFAKRRTGLLAAICIVATILIVGIISTTYFALENAAKAEKLQTLLEEIESHEKAKATMELLIMHMRGLGPDEINFAELEQYITQSDSATSLYFELGLICESSEDYENAIKYFSKALESFDEQKFKPLYEVRSHSYLGDIYRWESGFEDNEKSLYHASMALSKATAADFDAGWIRIYKQRKFWSMENVLKKEIEPSLLDEAVLLTKTLVEDSRSENVLDDEFSQYLMAYSDALLLADRYEDAHEVINEAIRLTSTRAGLLSTLIFALGDKADIYRKQELWNMEIATLEERVRKIVELHGEFSLELDFTIGHIAYTYGYLIQDRQKSEIFYQRLAEIHRLAGGVGSIGYIDAKLNAMSQRKWINNRALHNRSLEQIDLELCNETIKELTELQSKMVDKDDRYFEASGQIFGCLTVWTIDKERAVPHARNMYDELIVNLKSLSDHMVGMTLMRLIDLEELEEYALLVEMLEGVKNSLSETDVQVDRWIYPISLERNKFLAYASSGSLAQAIEQANLLLSLLETPEEEMEALFRISTTLTNNGFHSDAIQYARIGVKLLPTVSINNKVKSRYLTSLWTTFHLGGSNEAIAVAKERLAVNNELYGNDHPFAIDALCCLGMSYVSNSMFTEAVPYLQKAYEQFDISEPRNSRVFAAYNLGHCYLALNNTPLAKKMYREVVDTETVRDDIPHELAFSKQELGHILVYEGKYEEAIGLLQHAVNFDKSGVNSIFSGEMSDDQLFTGPSYWASLLRNYDALLKCYDMTEQTHLASELRDEMKKMLAEYDKFMPNPPSSN